MVSGSRVFSYLSETFASNEDLPTAWVLLPRLNFGCNGSWLSFAAVSKKTIHFEDAFASDGNTGQIMQLNSFPEKQRAGLSK